MKALILLATLLLPRTITYCAKAQGPSAQDLKIGLLEVIWKIKIEPAVETEASQSQKRITFNIYLPDNLLKEKKPKLNRRCDAIIMVMAELGAIDSTTTETVHLNLYTLGTTRLTTSYDIPVHRVLSNYRTMTKKVRGLFILFPYPHKVRIHKKRIDAHLYAPDSLYKAGADYGYLSLSNSVIITKYFARLTGSIPILNFLWEDPLHQKNLQSFSTGDASYQFYENSFLQTK